jgi:hypothetical protein
MSRGKILTHLGVTYLLVLLRPLLWPNVNITETCGISKTIVSTKCSPVWVVILLCVLQHDNCSRQGQQSEISRDPLLISCGYLVTLTASTPFRVGWTGKYLEGNGRGLKEVMFRNFFGETEENHKIPNLDSNAAPPEYNCRLGPLC